MKPAPALAGSCSRSARSLFNWKQSETEKQTPRQTSRGTLSFSLKLSALFPFFHYGVGQLSDLFDFNRNFVARF